MKATGKIKSGKRLPLPKEVSEIFVGAKHIQPYSLFYLINKHIPSKLNFPNINKKELLKALLKEFKLAESDLISSKTFDFNEEAYELHSLIIPIRTNLFVYFNSGSVDEDSYVELLFCPATPKLLVNKLEEIIKSHYSQNSHIGKIYLLQMSDYGLIDLNAFDVQNNRIDIKKYYNDDFYDIDSIIKTRLNSKNDKGLIMLHGKTGTGKTSYIRYLTTQINKRLIFLSPEITHKISSPDFVGILSQYPNSVIIIEDAENVIEERKAGGSSAISNLLNLTDGILADCLKIQIICTFNTDVSRIDKALLRKGRLIAKYEFKDLEQNKAQELSNSLGFKTNIKKNMALSEIFNQDEKAFQTENEVKIGFNVGDQKIGMS